MLIASGDPITLGVESDARLRFGEEDKKPGTWAGRRLMWLDGRPAFELSYWCGTCPFLFKRLEGSNETLSRSEMQERLDVGLDGVDAEVIAEFAPLLPQGTYRPLLLQVQPRLIYPLAAGDYFADEEVATWGIHAFWGLPEYPQTPYYRGLQTAVSSDAHFFEFIVPMVPPSWNDRDTVRQHAERLTMSSGPTAVAVSILDVRQPATIQGPDYFIHWCLTHFLLDGHHKLEAAATDGRALRLLSLLAIDESLAKPEQLEQVPHLLAQQMAERPPSPSK